MADESMMGVISDDPSKLGPKTAEERFYVDYLQQLVVEKSLPDRFVIGVAMREGEDMRFFSLGAEHTEHEDPAELLPFMIRGTKHHGPPDLPGLKDMAGLATVSTGCRLVMNDEATEAYMELRRDGFEVWLQDFPGAQKTRMAMMADGHGKLYMATMSEDDEGIQSFDRPLVADVLDNVEERTQDGIGGAAAKYLNDLARLFREGAK